jgi:hypothetical protein
MLSLIKSTKHRPKLGLAFLLVLGLTSPVAANEAEALFEQGEHHLFGYQGAVQSKGLAAEDYCKAAALGYAPAFHRLSMLATSYDEELAFLRLAAKFESDTPTGPEVPRFTADQRRNFLNLEENDRTRKSTELIERYLTDRDCWFRSSGE